MNPLKTEYNLNYIWICSSYRAVNIFCLGYENESMLHWEITAVCSEVRTKHINANCGQNVKFLSTKPDGAKLIQLFQFGYIAVLRIFCI
jgi:hypothetical protein